jgi:pyrroloquinoline quinone (PQQ) biosynthesis protein C
VSQFFLEVISQTDESRRAFEAHPVVLDAVANGMPVDRYRKLLAELYHVVWHFNPTCAAAASRMTDDFAVIRQFLYKHMHDESGHEQWVLNDLEAVGVNNAAVSAYLPSTHTLTLLGYNYWSADRRHPCSVLGMMYVLEVIASVYGGPFCAAMKEVLLLQDDQGTSFINSHATLDAQHLSELKDVLNLVHSDVARASIIESIVVNFHHLMHIFAAV